MTFEIPDPAKKQSSPERSTDNDKTPLFCMSLLCGAHCLTKCDKPAKAGLVTKFHGLGQLTWKEISDAPREGMGYEHIPWSDISVAVPDSVSEDERAYVFRFNGGPGSNGRFFGVRRRRTLHIIAIDPKGKAYKH